MTELSFHTEHFDGPLDLLLFLISKNKVDIKDIPISLILDQYLEKLESMEYADNETASRFILMTAQLILIKSKMLLPREDPAEDPRAPLANALELYQFHKNSGVFLTGRYTIGCDLICKQPEVLSKADLPYGGTVKSLERAFNNMYIRAQKNRLVSSEAFSPIVGREYVPVELAANYIMRNIDAEEKLTLSGIIERMDSRSAVVAVILALLELVKLNMIRIYDGDGETIIIRGEGSDE